MGDASPSARLSGRALRLSSRSRRRDRHVVQVIPGSVSHEPTLRGARSSSARPRSAAEFMEAGTLAGTLPVAV